MRNIIIIFGRIAWNKILSLLIVAVILSACSTRKYAYYFGKYSTQTSVSKKTTNSKYLDSLTVFNKVNIESSPLALQREVVDANISDKVVLATKETKTLDKRESSEVLDQNGSGKKLLAYIKKTEPSDDSKLEGDKKKNGFAVIGFILSLGGLVFFPLAYVGILFSAIKTIGRYRTISIAICTPVCNQQCTHVLSYL